MGLCTFLVNKRRENVMEHKLYPVLWNDIVQTLAGQRLSNRQNNIPVEKLPAVHVVRSRRIKTCMPPSSEDVTKSRKRRTRSQSHC
jgi:hypothetical protein